MKIKDHTYKKEIRVDYSETWLFSSVDISEESYLKIFGSSF